MKQSGKGSKPARGRRHTKCVIVDGYNILARLAAKSLADIDNLETARHELIEQLVEYQAYFGEQVVVVFDAQHTSSPLVESVWRGIQVTYTAPHETADQRIERLVYEYRLVYHSITVASSDIAEQQVAFGGGALRISAEEMIRRMILAGQQIQETVSKQNEADKKPRLSDVIGEDIAKTLEKWRRE
ncbi:NYN domain-containing protein [Alicyclobacillus sp. SO9]|uniref:NYN domain-containing protein n=1 Tax=Alicyclobacillus sp. SO9 TaxID=2665646 RepID=UPI0018E79E72|nr:NYN domain-containing protein [Alicyclobacillus sp. SO9]QQE78546.1 NYN domain-containing protein [Alicyclobacillus sp. SO9]